MAFDLLETKRRARRSAEKGMSPSPWGGRLAIALVYPNTYYNGMSNLGFQYVHHFLNQREETLCERFFLPDPQDGALGKGKKNLLVSLESGRPLADFDLVCFSISFENDYLNLPRIFDLARLPLFSAERDERHPLIVCGGVTAFLNPEPLADIMDVFAVGEGEVLLPPLIDALLQEGERKVLLKRIAFLPGFYVPRFYRVIYREDGRVAACHPLEGVPQRVRRQWVRDLNGSSCRSFLFCRDSEFASMGLMEISRGCGQGCRFCAAGHIYLPPRERSPQALAADMEAIRPFRDKFGLVSAAVSDYSRLPELVEEMERRGASFSVSSVRIDSLDRSLLRHLIDCGHRTLTLAPEAGSARLRNVINKNFDERQILDCVMMATAEGIVNIKLYFLIGLPTESEQDIEDLNRLVEKIQGVWMEESKKLGRLGNLSLSVNPFIPKPFTPFQWEPMAPLPLLKERIKAIRLRVGRLPGAEVYFESLRAAQLQAFLARGDRRVARTLVPLSRGENLRQACREAGLDPDFYIHRPRGKDELFPWEVIDDGVTRDYLWREHEKGLRGETSLPCGTLCRQCGVCSF
ncbi:MAG: radical SAM protein [Desulfuromonadaceae bacterium]|nr:radical SAM protein [Desulfuromonadaceae bacterium]